jgi:hypothetical protein
MGKYNVMDKIISGDLYLVTSADGKEILYRGDDSNEVSELVSSVGSSRVFSISNIRDGLVNIRRERFYVHTNETVRSTELSLFTYPRNVLEALLGVSTESVTES